MTGPLPDHDYKRIASSPGGQEAVISESLAGREMRHLYFGDFSVEIDASGCRALFRGNDPVGLSDLPREVLFVLLKHRPRPVAAKMMLKELWHPGANPSNVAKQVKALRLELGDEQSGRYIRTLKKEGYAFVMPVTESRVAEKAIAAPQPREDYRRVEHTPIAAVSPSSGTAGSISIAEWRLAKEKLIKDFAGSCLHDLELLEEATEECDGRIRLITDVKHLQLDGRFPHEPIFVPPRGIAVGQGAAMGGPDPQIASITADLIRYSKGTPVVVNVGSYAPACISVLQSLRRRYGLQLRSDFDGLSGRQQILQLFHNDEADFLLAPHAPFLLVGDHGARDYRRVTPVHAYQQYGLQAPGPAKGRRRKLLIYKGGYPEEQLMAHVGIPTSAEPEIVTSLETLITKVHGLASGDMVIAWEPLASGLESKHQYRRFAEYRCWVSLFCHKRWQRGSLRTLKSQFVRLFTSEWMHCRRNREWAIECLGVELKALEFFTAGSGLGPNT